MKLNEFLKKLIIKIISIYSAFFVIGAILTPIYSYFGLYNLSAKMAFVFVGSCHQNPLRSFTLFGYPFALCSRCFGVYLACTIASLFLLKNKFNINKLITVLIILFIVIDLSLNIVFSINTGNLVRFFAGFALGVIGVKIIQYLMLKGENI